MQKTIGLSLFLVSVVLVPHGVFVYANENFIQIDESTSKTVVKVKSVAESNASEGSSSSARSESTVIVNGENVSGKITSEVNGEKKEQIIDKPGTYTITTKKDTPTTIIITSPTPQVSKNQTSPKPVPFYVRLFEIIKSLIAQIRM